MDGTLFALNAGQFAVNHNQRVEILPFLHRVTVKAVISADMNGGRTGNALLS